MCVCTYIYTHTFIIISMELIISCAIKQNLECCGPNMCEFNWNKENNFNWRNWITFVG